MDDTRKYLHAMFGTKPADTYIAIWQTPLKRTKRFKQIEDAALFIEKTKDKKVQIYCGCGLQDKDHGSARRGTKEDIVSLPGFYMDIDIASKVHKNKNLPKNIDEAVKLVMENGFDPTMIVFTGHGIQAYWLFKEPEMFTDAGHREKVETVCRRLQETIKQKAAKSGWALDSTYDTTRVLRVPGTYNHKSDPVLSEIILDDGPRYSCIEDFDEFLIAEDQLQKISPAPTHVEQQTILDNIKVDPNVEPPWDLIDMLSDIDPKFRATWRHERDPESFPKGKASPSEYALSLASIAVQASCTDQEITNLIISWYRRHGHDMKKATRGDYIARTLAVAKKDVDEQFIENYKKNIEPTEGTDYHKAVDPKFEYTRSFLCKTFRLKTVRLIKHFHQPVSFYIMVTDKGDVIFENKNKLINRGNFKAEVFDQINHIITVPPRQWPGIVDKFTIIMEIETEPESYIADRIGIWLKDYLENKHPFDQHETTQSREPFIHKGHWYVYGKSFSSWCYHHKGHLEGVKKTQIDLTLAGAKLKHLNPRHPNKKNRRTTRWAYEIPHSICKPDPKARTKAKSMDGYMGSADGEEISTLH